MKPQNKTILGVLYMHLFIRDQWRAEELLGGGCDKRNLPTGWIEDTLIIMYKRQI